MRDIEKTIRVLKKLKEMGVKISIDDFGTGYSSLSYLKQFPIDTLKIDQSFISSINNDLADDNLTIANIVIDLGHKLGMKVIAEGVETEQQVKFLKKYIYNLESLNISDDLMAAIIIPDKDIIPESETLSPAFIIFENYEKILNWNRSLRFALAVCTLKENFKNEI